MESTRDQAATSLPIPVVLCGKTTTIGQIVTSHLHPELQVIHFFTSQSSAADDLPSLLSGQGPKSPSPNDIGTHDYSKPPRAVVFGRAFDVVQVKELVDLCRGKGSVPVAWIVGDPDAKAPVQPGPDYAKQAADSVKRAFARWVDEGEKDGEILYY